MPDVSTFRPTLRPGTDLDAIDGIVPRRVAEPEDAATFAATLAAASGDRLQTVIRGGGSKLEWGKPAPRLDLVVSTARLNRLVAHRHGDLTATVQSGMTLVSLNAALRGERQWLPVDSAFERATLGGIVATNDAGPSRHRNGTPRDLVIGITLALTDGRLVKAGGHVVKNVAGYDLGKLVSGSHGSIAGIVDVTFKLVPIPAASATLSVIYADPGPLAADVAALSGSQVEPAAFDVVFDDTYAMHVRIATSPAATEAQIAAARALVSGEARVVTGDAEAALWKQQVSAPWTGHEAVIRFSWLPANLLDVLNLVGEIRRSGTPATLVARAMGTGFARLGGDARAQTAAVARLRGSGRVGNLVVLRASREVKASVDVWGPARDADIVARSIKQMFDPAGILNAARGPI